MPIKINPDEIIVSRTKSIYSIIARRRNGAAIWLPVFYLLGIVLEMYSVHFIQYTDCWRYLLPAKWVATLFGGNASQSQVRIADVFTTRRQCLYTTGADTTFHLIYGIVWVAVYVLWKCNTLDGENLCARNY